METGLYDKNGKSLKLNDVIKINFYTYDNLHGNYFKYEIHKNGLLFILKYVESELGKLENQVDYYLTDFFKEGLLNGTYKSERVELCGD